MDGLSLTSSAGAIPSLEVTFSESCLPPGTVWAVTLDGSTQASSTNATVFSEKPGTYAYSVVAVPGYRASPGNGTVTVAGSAVSIPLAFGSDGAYSGPAYPVTFQQTGFPENLPWSVTTQLACPSSSPSFGASNPGPSIEYAMPNGTYRWSVSPLDYYSSYHAVPQNGTLTLDGHGVTVPIEFLPTVYVQFNETGLSNYSNWEVLQNGSIVGHGASSPIGVFVVNGTYSFTGEAFGYSAAPIKVTVNGASLTETFSFTPLPVYPVTFTESGLLPGTAWFVTPWTLNGGVEQGVRAPSAVVIIMPEGSYTFDISALGYVASPTSVELTVLNASLTEAVSFAQLPTYNVTFAEKGLPQGDNWTIDWIYTLEFNEPASEVSSVAPQSIQISVSVGEINWEAVGPDGYYMSPQSGDLTITNASQSVVITFSLSPPPSNAYNVTFAETGLPASATWILTVQLDGAPTALCQNFSLAGAAPECSLPDGNYSWWILSTAANYTANPSVGTLTVHGADVREHVEFQNTSGEDLVQFSYYGGGLPNGTSWTVTMGGVTQATTGMFLDFLEPNGTTTPYAITPPANFVALPGSGSVAVNYTAETGDIWIDVAFVQSPGPTPNVTTSSSAGPGLPALVWLGIGLSAGLAVGVVAVAYRILATKQMLQDRELPRQIVEYSKRKPPIS